jgi:hypothetical protein
MLVRAAFGVLLVAGLTDAQSDATTQQCQAGLL